MESLAHTHTHTHHGSPAILRQKNIWEEYLNQTGCSTAQRHAASCGFYNRLTPHTTYTSCAHESVQADIPASLYCAPIHMHALSLQLFTWSQDAPLECTPILDMTVPALPFQWRRGPRETLCVNPSQCRPSGSPHTEGTYLYISMISSPTLDSMRATRNTRCTPYHQRSVPRPQKLLYAHISGNA